METATIENAVEGIKLVNQAFEEFKKANDANLAKHDVLLEEKTNRINDDISRMEARLVDLDKEVKRAAVLKQADEKSTEWKKFLDGFAKKSGKHDLGEYSDQYFAGEKKDHRVSVERDGGYLVIPEMIGVIAALEREVSNFRQLASVQQTASDSIEVVSYNTGTAAGWVEEADTRPTTATAQFQKITIPVKELYANPACSQKMLDDAGFDFAGWLIGQISASFAEIEGRAFIAGTGIAQPRGILTYPTTTSYSFGSVVQVPSGTGAINTDALFDLQQSLKTVYQANASFLMNRSTIGAIRKLRFSGTDTYIWQPSYQAGVPSTMLGSPVIEMPDMPNTALNALPVAYGDFRTAYQIADRLGLQVLRDPYTNKGGVSFYTTRRVGGGVKQFDALALLRIS